MRSSSKPSPMEDSLLTSDDTKTSEKSLACVTCVWLSKQQKIIQTEMLKHLAKFHPPTTK